MGLGIFVCIFTGCHGHSSESAAIRHALHSIANDLLAIKRELRIHNAEQEQHMSKIEDKLTEVETAVADEAVTLGVLTADETRELADLQAIKDNPTQELTPEQEARFDALTAAITANKAAEQADDDAINAVDPAPATPPAGE